MPRHLDLSALRSFLMVAETGGVTRAAGFLNLTQSAVSMQIKRLEEALDLQLLDRSGRGVTLTVAGEQLLAYARRLLAINDEALGRLTERGHEGTIVLGVPCDILHPTIPQVLRRFAAEFPRVQASLVASYSRRLLAMFERGDCDLILTTEEDSPPGAETLAELPLIWVGAPGGSAWRNRPLPLAFVQTCIFRPTVLQLLEEAGMPWVMAVEADSSHSTEASVGADLAVMVLVEGNTPPYLEPVAHGGQLPDLTRTRINLHVGAGQPPAVVELAGMIRQAFHNRRGG